MTLKKTQIKDLVVERNQVKLKKSSQRSYFAKEAKHVEVSMIYFTIILAILGMISSFGLGYTFGKFKGAKDGIDYCFEQMEKKQST